MTDKITHTPGPWAAQKSGVVYDGAGLPIKCASGWSEDTWYDLDQTDESRANAHLIAAAPDLLAALEALLAEARERGGGVSNGELLGCAAITKARGGN